MQPGLRRIAAGALHLTPNRIGGRALREKLAVLSSFAADALLCQPGFDDGPALDALVAHAVREHPQAISSDGVGKTLQAWQLGWSLCADVPLPLAADAPPEVGACLSRLPARWRRTALLCLAFAEDFAIIDGLTACIPWLAVCLPSHWSPRDKVGRHFADVHAPVADNGLLLAAAEHLARLVTGPECWERFVWTISRHPRLFAHPDHVDPAPWPPGDDAERLGEQAFFRTERQTFIPLPGLRQAVFTIHVDVNPLSRVVERPADASRLHDALASMSEAVLKYRGLTGARDGLLDWLSRRAPISNAQRRGARNA